MPEAVNLYVLYPPAVVIVGLPVVVAAAANASEYLSITTPLPPAPLVV